MSDKKQKKAKVRYIDDGRSLADMSGIRGGDRRHYSSKGTLRDQARTYWNAVKLMFIPMLVTIGIISLAFFIMWLMLTVGTAVNA